MQNLLLNRKKMKILNYQLMRPRRLHQSSANPAVIRFNYLLTNVAGAIAANHRGPSLDFR
jgi:hypothetical protein